MLIGGLALSFVKPPWSFSGQWDAGAALGTFFIVLFGTLIAFYCYMESLKHLDAAEASILSCLEPLTSALLAVIWLKTLFGPFDWLGAACIVGTVILLSVRRESGGMKASETEHSLSNEKAG